MKFFLNKSLKFQSLSLLLFFLVVLLCQFLFIHHEIERRDRNANGIDFARKAQTQSNDIALQMQQVLNGNTALSSAVISDIQTLEQMHAVFENGGRVNDQGQTIDPLDPIPMVSFKVLKSQWQEFKNSTLVLLSEEKETIRETLMVDDSTGIAETITELKVNQNFEKARMIVNGQWKNVSTSYDKLIHDLYTERARANSWLSALLWGSFLVDTVLILAVFYWIQKQLLSPIKLIGQNTKNHIHTYHLKPNEIGLVAKQVNEVIEELKDASEFIERIGDGDLSLNYQVLDNNYAEGKNKLADSLVSMQSKLRTINENDEKRKWANEGLATFSDILRSSQDIQTLGDKIIGSLVQYTKSNQGGIYLLNDENPADKYLELISLFAFDHKKFESRKVKLGEGLLGQTFLEKETTHLTKVPDDYIKITSGLGDAKPGNILLIPLKIDKDVYGMVELASLNQYLPHEIAFVEKLGESIAATLSSVKASEKNAKLLEEFKMTTEAMRSQEEEMRQNMEELQATQEEMARKENSYLEKIRELEENKGNPELVQQLTKEMKEIEAAHVSKIKQLEEALTNKDPHGDEWAPAVEIEKALQLQVEGLRITQEELRKRGISK